ncbi:hypothetical protein, partial [uncultured Selenomonas sp.]|uniref:hypothetical protein n=1 Tax=uncultured Selenomonas sp. TaxID=159275 RepID=UPI0025F05451
MMKSNTKCRASVVRQQITTQNFIFLLYHNIITQTSHTENIPYALKIQHELDVKIHSCTPLPIQ